MAGLFQRNFFSERHPKFVALKKAETKPVLDVIARLYPKLRVRGVSRVVPFGGRKGLNSENWKIVCTNGDFILKRTALDRAEALKAKAEWTRGLGTAGFRVPRFYPDDGDIVRRGEGAAYCLSHFVHGRYSGNSFACWKELLRCERRLVKYCLAHSPKDAAKRFGERTFFDASMALSGALPAAERRYIESKHRELEGFYERENRKWKRTLFHVDIHPLNALFRGGRLALLLDFDSFQQTVLEMGLGFSMFKCGREFLIGASSRDLKRRLVSLEKIFQQSFDRYDFRTMLLCGQIDVLKRYFGALGDPKWGFMRPVQLAGLREIDKMLGVLAS